MEITVFTEICLSDIDNMGLRGHESKLFKRRFRLAMLKLFFSKTGNRFVKPVFYWLLD